jgi:hypothetical protein
MDKKEGDNPSRDALLLQLLRTPPQPRTERKRPRDRAETKLKRTRASSGENDGADVRR